MGLKDIFKNKQITMALQRAKDESTPSDALRQIVGTSSLGERDWHPVLKSVTAHPNTPPDVLVTLVAHFPDAFLTNPAAPLLLLEDPGFFNRISSNVLKDLLRRNDVPEVLLLYLKEHRNPGVAQDARMHVGLVGVAEPADDRWELEARKAIAELPLGREENLLEMLELGLAPANIARLLAGSRRAQIRREAAPRVNGLFDLLVRASGTSDLSHIAPGYNPELSGAELKRLASGGPWMRDLAARHPKTSPYVLDRLADDPNRFVRGRVAANPATPAEALERLADTGYEPYLILLAANPAVGLEILERLAHNPFPRVRSAAARHPDLPLETLIELSMDQAAEVRASVARHPRTPDATRAMLASDADASVRRAACHIGLPKSGLSLRRPGDFVKSVALEVMEPARIGVNRPVFGTDEELMALAESEDESVLLRLARSPDTPPRVLRRLLILHHTWELPPLRLAVAANPGSPPELLELLSNRSDSGVKLAVASNPAADEKTLCSLAGNGDVMVRRAALRHPRAAEWHLAQTARSMALAAARAHPPSLLRLMGLLSAPPGADQEESLSTSPEWIDRFACAMQFNQPSRKQLAALAEDGNRLVRVAARARIADPQRNWNLGTMTTNGTLPGTVEQADTY